ERAVVARDMDRVGRLVPRDAARLDACGPARDDLAVHRIREREQRIAAAQRDVDATRAVFDDATGLIAGSEGQRAGHLTGDEVDTHDLIAIGISDDGVLAVACNDHGAAGDGYTPWRWDLAVLA